MFKTKINQLVFGLAVVAVASVVAVLAVRGTLLPCKNQCDTKPAAQAQEAPSAAEGVTYSSAFEECLASVDTNPVICNGLLPEEERIYEGENSSPEGLTWFNKNKPSSLLPESTEMSQVVHVSADNNYSTHITTADGHVYSWGYNGSYMQFVNALRAHSYVRQAMKVCKSLTTDEIMLPTVADTSPIDGNYSKCEAEGGYLADVTGAAKMVAGWNTAYVLMQDGTVMSGGNGSITNGFLGRIKDNISVPKVLGDRSVLYYVDCGATAGTEFCSAEGHLQKVKDVSAGVETGYALLENGNVVSWGAGTFGGLGDGSDIAKIRPVYVVCGEAAGTPFCVNDRLTGVKDITDMHGRGNTALMSDGHVMSWGVNSVGQLGDDTAPNVFSKNTPVFVHCGEATDSCDNGNLIAEAIGNFSAGTALAIMPGDRSLIAWGNNSNGQLGDGTNTNRATPVYVHGIGGSGRLTGVTSAVEGAYATFAIMSDGSALSWGDNTNGRLASGVQEGNRPFPDYVKVCMKNGKMINAVNATDCSEKNGTLNNLTGVKMIASGYDVSFALMNDGIVITWGANSYGATSYRSIPGYVTPVRTKGPGGIGTLSGVKQVSGQITNSAFALEKNENGGKVLAWGTNAAGELGNGTFTNSLVPNYVRCGEAEGNANACSVPSTPPFPPSAPTTKLQNVTAIEAKASFTLAIQNGNVLAWGINNEGQLGNGNTLTSSIPTYVHCGEAAGAACSSDGKLQNVTAVSRGPWGTHSLAIADGNVVAWGSNANGMLGIGEEKAETVYVKEPVYVHCGEAAGTPFCVNDRLTGVKAVVGDNWYDDQASYAILNNGTVLRWGGYPTVNAHSTLPKFVKRDGSNLTGVVAAYNHYFLLDNGTVFVENNNTILKVCRNGADFIDAGSLTACTVAGGTWADLTGVTEIHKFGNFFAVFTDEYYTNAVFSSGGITSMGELGHGDRWGEGVRFTNYGLVKKCEVAGNIFGLWIGDKSNLGVCPGSLQPLSGVKAMGASYDANFAILNDDSLVGWGNGSLLGIGGSAVPVSNLPIFVDIDGDLVWEDLCPYINASSLDTNHDGCIDTDIRGLINLVKSYNFSNGLETALTAKLNINSGNINQAINNINAFINLVEVKRASIGSEQADLMIAYAQNVLVYLTSLL